MITVNEYLQTLSKKLEYREKEKIIKSIDYLKGKIWSLFQNRLDDVIVFGSYDRETMLPNDKEGDVDIMIIFKKDEFQPKTYLNQIRSFSEKNYSKSEVYPEHPTVVIELNHVKFELVPTLWDSSAWSDTAMLIPGPPSENYEWVKTNPLEFTGKLNTKEGQNDNMIRPLIRLMKYWNLQNKKAFSSYWLEEFAVNHSYSFCNSLKDYFYEMINDLNNTSFNEEGTVLIQALAEKKRRLKSLEDQGLNEYLEQEFSSFLPML